MKVGIVGAGYAGLSAARILREFGHDIQVFESAPDVGGVWSRSRRYPGVETQNNRDTYCFSNYPMPKSYPEWPAGEQVQEYLASYCREFGLDEAIHLNTRVCDASLLESGWRVECENTSTGEASSFEFDCLVVANGIFCSPSTPAFSGMEQFENAGGRVCHTSEIHELAEARDRDVLVIGYGKSACDFATQVSEVTSSTTVIARHLIWKVTKYPAGIHNKYLLLTRLGEALFPYFCARGVRRMIQGPLNPIRRLMLRTIQGVVTRQLKLKELGLVPPGGIEDIARSNVSLATDGFYEKIKSGEIGIYRDTEIVRLGSAEGKPVATLSNGEVVAADVVACGTGWRQEVPFFSPELESELIDSEGSFQLYRQIQPIDVPNLYFCGYNSSFFSPLSAEVAALWIGATMAGRTELPSPEERLADVKERLEWMKRRTEGRHARGTNIIPFSMLNIDDMLNDVGTNVSSMRRFIQWLLPVDPLSYGPVIEKVIEESRAGTGESTSGGREPASTAR